MGLKTRLYGHQAPKKEELTISIASSSNDDNKSKEKEEIHQKKLSVVDPLWIDPKTGKFMSFIVKNSPIVADDEYDAIYISEYEEEEYDGADEESENEDYSGMVIVTDKLRINVTDCNKRSSVIPAQSFTDNAVYEFSGCNISDIDD